MLFAFTVLEPAFNNYLAENIKQLMSNAAPPSGD
jgi:hypothetical protein